MEGQGDSATVDGFAALVDRFGRGWEAGDVDWIPEVFAAEAAFVPDPFAAPLVGRSAIESYWKDVPRQQGEISFRAGEVYRAGPWFSVEFRCTFRRRRTGEPMDIRGAIFCETDAGLVTEMRMYWDRRLRPAR